VAAAGALLLAALTATGALRIWQVLAIAITTGAALAVYMPVVHAMVPSLVPSEHLPNAISLNSVRFNLARIIGPLIAGVAYHLIGAAGCFLMNGVTFLSLIFALAWLRLPTQPASAPASLLRQLTEGFSYARSQRLISAMLVLASGISFFAFPYIILMPAIARDALHLGPDGLGLMMGAVGSGAVAGGLALAAAGDVPRKAMLACGAAGALGISLVAFSLAPTLRVAAPLLFLMGATQVTCVASLNTTLQVTVNHAMRGRVMSMLTFALFGLSTLGSLFLGVLGDRIGVPGALRLGGAVILTLAAVLGARSPEIVLPVCGPTEIGGSSHTRSDPPG
jgi:predicted MFS family arabinose efflux permease